jgi:PAS domain S-box-containing protein
MSYRWSKSVLKIVLSYVLFAGLWILLSDQLLEVVSLDEATHTQWSIYKGWFFVLVTALLLVVLLRRELKHREHDQEALRESEARYRTLVENLPQRIFLKDRDSRYVSVNGLYASDFGLRPEQVQGKQDSALFPSDLAAKYRSDDQRIMQTGITDEFDEDYMDQGKPRIIHTIKTPVRDTAGRVIGILGVFSDITERKRLEQERGLLEAQLRQQQRLESLGTLAGGVAHEINNPINGVMNYAQLIQDRLPADNPLREYTEEILHETQRIATIVLNLLTFARNEKQNYSPARILDILEATLSLIRTIIRHDQITLMTDVPEDLPPLRCRSQQIQQVLMNLMTNARDALNERYPGHDPDKVLKVSARALEDQGQCWVRVTVEDHGMGILPQVRERMFDPFFTTKPRDKGTGLGLAISHGIIQEHQGRLFVETETGKFTRIHLDLRADDGMTV